MASGRVIDSIDPKVFLNVSEQSAKPASFLLAHGKHLDYALARNIDLAKLKEKAIYSEGCL
jgi:hypothetical protein